MNQPLNTSALSGVGSNRPWMHTLTLTDKVSATQVYMPFIKGGGVFIETEKEYNLKDPVFLLLTVGHEAKKFPINGKVVWLCGSNARGDRPRGIGVQFPKDSTGESAKLTIEEMTGKMFWSLPKTATF